MERVQKLSPDFDFYWAPQSPIYKHKAKLMTITKEVITVQNQPTFLLSKMHQIYEGIYRISNNILYNYRWLDVTKENQTHRPLDRLPHLNSSKINSRLLTFCTWRRIAILILIICKRHSRNQISMVIVIHIYQVYTTHHCLSVIIPRVFHLLYPVFVYYYTRCLSILIPGVRQLKCIILGVRPSNNGFNILVYVFIECWTIVS